MADRYWVGASGSAWNVTSSWSATSGGASGASVPTTTDNAIFDSATTYTVTCTGNLSLINFTVSAGTVTFTSTGTLTVSGNFSLSTGTVWNATGLILFSGTAARTITTSGTTIGASVTFSGVSGVFQLQDALTLDSARTLTIQNGRLDLNNKALVTGFFNSEFTSARGIDYGTSGSLTCIGAGGIMMTLNAASGWTMTGTQTNNISYSGATAVTISNNNPGEATALSINITAGTYTLTMLAQNRNYKSINFTGFSGTLVAPFGANQIYGDFTLSSTMTLQASTGEVVFSGTSGLQTITSNAKTMDFPIGISCTGSTVRLADALTSGATRTTSLTVGTFDLNGKTFTTGLFRAINTTTRVIAFGIGNITCIGASGTIFDTGAITGLSITGTPTVNISSTAVSPTIITVATGTPTEANSFSFNFTGTHPLVFLAGANARNVSFSGFTGTWNARTGTSTVYGDLTVSSGMTYTASTGTLLFASTSGTKTITTNAKTIDQPVQFNGVGGRWQLQDAFTMGTARALTHANGTIDLNGKTLTVGTSYTTAAGTKNLTFNLGTLVCPVAGATAFNNAAPTGFTTTEGTPDTIGLSPKISMSAATAQTFVGGGSAFNCYINNDGAKTLTISGNNTFKGTYNLGIGLLATLALTGNNSFGTIEVLASGATINLLLTAGSTQTFTTSFGLRGDATASCAINTTVAGSKATINKTFSGVGGKGLYVFFNSITVSDYLVVRDIDFTPNTATTNGSDPFSWYLGANSTNSGNNTGAAFVTYPQVVYYISNAATTSWATPADWNPTNNAIYLVGGGGGASAGAYFSSSSKAGGAGGGGGGYTAVSNYSIGASSTISSIVIGAGGTGGSTAVITTSTGGTGGSTTIPNPSGGTYSAGGGAGGVSIATSAVVRSSTPGAGGTGSNFNGGSGGTGATSTTTANGISGSGGGGAGGPNGVGAVGGLAATSGVGGSGGGGGGNGGGSNGAALNGGNNSQGFGGGVTGTPATAGRDGGGGGAGQSGVTGSNGGNGSTGIDILKTIGGGGGAGGGRGTVGAGASSTGGSGVTGGGGAGSGISDNGNRSTGGAGGSGIIVITYTPFTGSTGNFFFMF
jgi:hypothetical protein